MPDDFSANTSTSGRVTVGSTSFGNIEESGDHDWFAVTLTSGTQYQLRATSAGLSDPLLTLRNSAGSFLASDDDSGGNLNALINFTANSSGTYYLDAQGLGIGTGNYTVSMTSLGVADDYAANSSTSGRVAVGGSSAGRIETFGDHDWFQVTLTAGTQYQLRATSDGLSDPLLTLRNSAGSFLASDDDSGGNRNALITFTANSSGTYYLDAQDLGIGTGNYTVSMTSLGAADDYAANSSTSGRVAVGGSSLGRIETNGDHDWFQVSLTAGTQYQLRATSAGLSDPLLTLRNSAGSFLATDDDSGGNRNSFLTFTAGSSGTYYLDIQDYGSGTGNYTVSMTSLGVADDYASNSSTSGRLAVGGSSSGRIETNGDHDWFQVSLTAGTQYQLRATSAGLSDPLLTLRNSAGSFLATDDDSGGNRNSFLTFTAGSSGTYYLDIQDYGSGTGNYTVSMTSLGAADDYASNSSTSGRVAVGGSSSGMIERSGDHDWFAVTLDAGTQYQLRADSAGLSDPLLTLRNSGGTSLTSNDDSGGTLNSLITFTAASSGTYYLDVQHYSSGTGSYRVSATAIGGSSGTDDFAAGTGTTGRVAVGGASSGLIERSGDHDWFAVTVTAGTQYQFQVNASGNGLSDPFLTLRDGGGNFVRSDDDSGDGLNSLITHTATSTGTYYLDVQHYTTGTGAYSVSAASLSAPVPTPTPSGGFQITVNYSGNAAYQQTFRDAAARWEQIITQDLPDYVSPRYGRIDDLVIDASIIDIDGAGRNGRNILGQANYDELRPTGSRLPSHGFMQFDAYDIGQMAANQMLYGVILHEMGHVLGLGRPWLERGLVTLSGNQYIYTGGNAVNEYRVLTGNNGVTFVPIESSTGNAGSDGVHWAESVFVDELMTPSAGGRMSVSRMSIGSLQDLGYGVNYGAADAYTLPGRSRLEAPAEVSPVGIAPLDSALLVA